MEWFFNISIAIVIFVAFIAIMCTIVYINFVLSEYKLDSPGKLKWYNTSNCSQKNCCQWNWVQVKTLSRTKKMFLSPPHDEHRSYQEYKTIKILSSNKVLDVHPMFLYDEMPRS